ncbi:MAG: hypothetical protein FJ137_16610 [Deltaproteobacteria bacterium]|nr:hypothetical protein [Deltaproteobacteria bacterium]
MKTTLATLLLALALAPQAARADEGPPSSGPAPLSPSTSSSAPPAATSADPAEPVAASGGPPGGPPAASPLDAPPAPEATPPPAPDTRTLRDDPVADAALAACTAKVGAVDDGAEAVACFRAVAAGHPGTLAAVKADASAAVLERKPATTPGIIPPGRLGITAAAGLFGVWNGVAAGWTINANVPNLDSTAVAGATGVGAVLVGVGFGAGGYFLAERWKLNEGAARLVASGLVWGSVIGTGLAPTIYDAINGGDASAPPFSVAMLGIVGMGYVGGGAALLATTLTTFDEAQVAMLNSGGIAGATIGVLLLPNLSVFRVSNVLPYSLNFVGATVAGLAAGTALGRIVDLTWGETLICDLGMVLGGVLGGTGSLVSGSFSGSWPETTRVLVATALPAVGLIGGYGAALGFLTSWRSTRGAPIWREAPKLRVIAGVLPVGRGVVPTWGLAGEL